MCSAMDCGESMLGNVRRLDSPAVSIERLPTLAIRWPRDCLTVTSCTFESWIVRVDFENIPTS